uniref:Macaca fascicularis brain cDNA clone: QtrA-17263, similar to human hypothetical protein MGC33510 (MGC33510), mRNA, RefSeq: NM_152765.2 n=1 Tax=Macaca fascicularis TaxID=9541 RepID=I7GHX0_MACFA|nr:unnamed protein product [Macaca fascicularis]
MIRLRHLTHVSVRLRCLCYSYSFTQNSSEHREGPRLINDFHPKH